MITANLFDFEYHSLKILVLLKSKNDVFKRSECIYLEVMECNEKTGRLRIMEYNRFSFIYFEYVSSSQNFGFLRKQFI